MNNLDLFALSKLANLFDKVHARGRTLSVSLFSTITHEDSEFLYELLDSCGFLAIEMRCM